MSEIALMKYFIMSCNPLQVIKNLKRGLNMAALELTESQLANMAEQAALLAALLKIMMWMRFDNCYQTDHAVDDLWNTIIEGSIMNFEKHLVS